MKLFSFFLVFFFVGLQMVQANEDLNISDDNLGEDIWEACQTIASEIGNITFPIKLYRLRIVEYNTLSTRNHNLFPSAATSLFRSEKFNPQRKTIIFIHGHKDYPLSRDAIALAYKLRGNHNILALDTSKLMELAYLRSAAWAKYIGEGLGVVLRDLVRKGVPVENIHLVGFGVGAHIGGLAGKYFQRINPGSILPRITGVDPAGVCFFNSESNGRLDRGDAAFVDVIHTTIGFYGINKTIGHVDFYVNDAGHHQPGCENVECSHDRGWELWAESVNRPNGFIAVKCDSWTGFKTNECKNNDKSPMGYGASSNVRGTYYLRTNFMFPFGLGKLGSRPSIIG